MATGPSLLKAHIKKNELTIRGFASSIGASPSAVISWVKRARRPGAEARLAIQRVAGIPFAAWPPVKRGASPQSP